MNYTMARNARDGYHTLAGSSIRLIVPETVAQDRRTWNSKPSEETSVTYSGALFAAIFQLECVAVASFRHLHGICICIGSPSLLVVEVRFTKHT